MTIFQNDIIYLYSLVVPITKLSLKEKKKNANQFFLKIFFLMHLLFPWNIGQQTENAMACKEWITLTPDIGHNGFSFCWPCDPKKDQGH